MLPLIESRINLLTTEDALNCLPHSRPLPTRPHFIRPVKKKPTRHLPISKRPIRERRKL